MKKLRVVITAFMLCVFTLALNAEHLKFMGIPITGTITNFQTKLQAKGITLKKNSNSYPTGIRAFHGVFAGKDCEILVWYNHRTKIVYRVIAVTDCPSLETAHSTFYYFKNLLIQKYDGQALTSDMIEDSTNDEYEFDMMVIQPPIQEGAECLGQINIQILDYDSYSIPYGVAINYEDWENSSKNEENTLNDL